ncbi:alpha,alpha-trehalase [Lewinella aquimaris]|uniref:Alpha,alpha-trehalase n=1 Tax=Neolewinella aquimaris TaxID=1835722 RepID=A0A840DZE5_9BACT|nr:alpha,alpha-trehalase TreF [Neolewinella aquimaris]MBB4078280.1 alpha,alpha-trehalase [Neolewinella aquimaris]
MRYFAFAILTLLLGCTDNPNAPEANDGPRTVTIRPDTILADQLEPPDILFGELFRRVQMEQLFEESKTFVDMIPRRTAAAIMADYAEQKGTDSFNLESFVTENFAPPINTSNNFASRGDRGIVGHINALWPVLTREAGSDEGGAGSLIVLPENYFVPGGRFREVYYWDSYFTMLGFATAGEVATVRDMVENFAYLIDNLGFIPNGNRTYYLTRSQPPFFSFMVDVLANIEGDGVYTEFLDQLKAEHRFWMDGETEVGPENRAVKHVVWMADSVLLNRYYDAGHRPRAESYREDLAIIRESERDSQTVAHELRSCIESGWNFSGRWFADGRNISTINTTEIVPPDLNSLLYHLEATIAEHSELIPEKNAWTQRAERRKRAVEKYLWNESTKWYEDLNWTTGRPTGYLSLAGIYPFFVGLADQDHTPPVVRRLKSSFLAAGGLRTTLNTTGFKFDSPNGWPPLQWMAYDGMKRYGANELASTIRRRWMDNNEKVYEKLNKLVQMYNVEEISVEAKGGGGYPRQDGFGWTNGVYLRMAQEAVDDASRGE